MSRTQKYFIAGEVFKTKGELQERIRSILWQYQDGQYLWPNDLSFMLHVLNMHPNLDVKIGVGVKAMYVRRNPVYKNTRGFWIVRHDDSETDFSYMECLKESSHEKRFRNALRVAVEPYTMNFKMEAFSQATNGTIMCPITGEPITQAGSHVHHMAPSTFQAIVSDFVLENGIDVDAVKINGCSVDGAIQDTLDDKDLERIWIEYHNAHAQLQVVSQRANLSNLRLHPDGIVDIRLEKAIR